MTDEPPPWHGFIPKDIAEPPADAGRRSLSVEAVRRVVEIGWTSTRAPEPLPSAPLPDPEFEAAWPGPPLPGKPLRPRDGPPIAGGLAENARTLFVPIFGLNPDQIEIAVQKIERQQRAGRNFRPVFLTDRADVPAVRRAGYTHEYFPPSVYGDEALAPAFERRFSRLWRKWRGAGMIDFSKPGYLARRLEDLQRYVGTGQPVTKLYDPRRPPPKPHRAPTDVAALRAEYQANGLAAEPDSFVLYRILGNDLPPRHELGQTLNNLRFMLEHEPELAGCEKRWVVNRIIDPDQEAAIIRLLEDHDQPYLHIPFRLEEYAAIDWDLESFPDDAFFLRGRYWQMDDYGRLRAEAHARRFKNNYVINNNGARNAALRDGRGRAKWVLPWDGNCFLTRAAWEEIVTAVTERPYLKYFTVPMSRTLDNAQLLDPAYRPEAEEEPQMLFRRDAGEEFDETFYYGRRPKVELFYRLGVPGKWDGWPDDVWDRPRPAMSTEAGAVGTAGWVARLFSGQTQLELETTATGTSGLRSRGEARINAVAGLLDRLDVEALKLVYHPQNLVAYDEAAVSALAMAEPGSPERRLHERLVLEAELALQRGPYSVVDKTATPPSGDPHDYYHPAPYWWPNPATPSGMPYVFRDGERIPGTRLYEPESERYDRTRLQRLFDDATTLALGWLATGREEFVAHAALLVRTWFLDERTRMNPHLLYSQIRSQSPNEHGAKSGLIEMKDLYYFLDAVRLVERAGKLSEEERAAFRDWLQEYLEWLETSEQGVGERLSMNNHGTCYDLQTGAIAAFLGDTERLHRIFRTSRERILEQFTPAGRQPHEMTRTQTAHYCCFNLQSWVNLANLAEACGDRLWNFEAADGRGLARAFAWLLPHMAQAKWKYQQIEPFDRGRFLPLFFAARGRLAEVTAPHLAHAAQARPMFFAHDGIKPFWMLGTPARYPPDSEHWAELAKKLRKLESRAFEMIHGPAFGEADLEEDARTLDKKLWGGFSAPAAAALARLRDGSESDAREANRAARALARWRFFAGDIAETLANIDAQRQLGVTGERERTLVRAWCLARLGQEAEARDLVEHALGLFPHDADLSLAMFDLSLAMFDLSLGTGRDDRVARLEWLNRLYRNAGFAEFLIEREGALAPRAEPPGPAEADSNAPTVSVLMPLGAKAGGLDASLTSLRAQSWPALEIIVIDHSGEVTATETVERHAAQDDRIRLVGVAPGTPLHAALNAGRAEASGEFVTVAGANELAHPERLRQQITPLLAQTAAATMPRLLRLDPAGRVLAGWHPDFGYLSDNASGLMLSRDLLERMGGWDAASERPEAFLIWRLRRLGEAYQPGVIAPGVPLSVAFGVVPDGQPTHLEFPYGRRRDELRSLMRIEKRIAEETAEGVDALATRAPLPPLPPMPEGAKGPFEAVFVGDFARHATAIDPLVGYLQRRISGGGRFGLFHWPDYHTTWNQPLHEEVAALLDEGRMFQVSAFEAPAAKTLVLCNPYIVQEPVDGFPRLLEARLEVLGGPELNTAEFFDGHFRRLPSTERLAAVFGRTPTWVSL